MKYLYITLLFQILLCVSIYAEDVVIANYILIHGEDTFILVECLDNMGSTKGALGTMKVATDLKSAAWMIFSPRKPGELVEIEVLVIPQSDKVSSFNVPLLSSAIAERATAKGVFLSSMKFVTKNERHKRKGRGRED